MNKKKQILLSFLIISLLFLTSCSLFDEVDNAKQTINQFYEHLKVQDYNSALDLMDVGTRIDNGDEELISFFEHFDERLGTITSHRIASYNVRHKADGRVIAEIIVSVKRSVYPSTETFLLEKPNEESLFQIREYDIKS